MVVGLGLGRIVLDVEPTPPPKKERRKQPPIFGPCLLRPNGWMDQDATWHGGGIDPGNTVLDEGQMPIKGAQPPIFGTCLLRPNGWMDQDVPLAQATVC